MNNNPELGNNQPANDAADRWNILPKDNFYQSRQNSEEVPNSEPSDDEIRQKIRAERRTEQLKNKAEAHEKAKRVAAKLLAVAIGVTALVGGSIATGPKDDFLKSEQAKQKVIEMENVEEIVFHGNIRSNPETTNSEDSNVYANIEDEVRLEIPEDSKILYYRNENDPNGGWIGVPVEDLEEQSYISKSEARRMRNDGDETAWINKSNVDPITK